ncbi:MAG: zinc-ribbon domain-containing protein [Ruminococcus sp.]
MRKEIIRHTTVICPVCGEPAGKQPRLQPQPRPQPQLCPCPQVSYCPKCGNAVAPNAEFCLHCGCVFK